MQKEERLLGYMQEAVSYLLKRGSFESGDTFKPTQKEALEAYDVFLNDNARSSHSRLKGYFEIPTGIGKTAIFVGIVGAAHKIAKANGEELKTIIVAPRNNLLTQALDDFKRFSPTEEDQIGLYGDGYKDLSKPITIMTYPAWIKLSRQGKIGSHNTHILVSDEGHRGTSENRVANISEVFNGATVRIAFTATAHFERTDQLNGSDKSVKNSHGHEIYYKPLQDAIRSGELAAYMQCRGLTIRVEPYGDIKNPSGELKQQLKQSAWNKRVVKLYAEGRDNRTGDLLSDNQAAFFVDGIVHAEKLEKLLNADPQLSNRAREKGCDGVAVAIHSLMLKAERNKKFEAYKAGKYMAAIGADMFKEGFSHRPLKTIFDYPRTSRVDKLQILGRGLRKWNNLQKEGRDEGLTFVEPLIYIGSDDPEIDKQREETARRNTVFVRDIVGSMVILSPTEARQTGNRNTNNREENPYIFINDDNVKEYVTEEDLFELSSEISELRKDHWIAIDDSLREKLKNLEIKTNVSAGQILRNMNDIPDGLYENKVTRWLNGSSDEADPIHVEYMLSKWEKILAGELSLDVNPNKKAKRKKTDNLYRITTDDIEKLNYFKKETRLGSVGILKTDKEKTLKLSRSVIENIFKGDIKEIEKETLDNLLKLYEDEFFRIKNLGIDTQRVEITDEILLRLKFLKEATGIGGEKLIKQAEHVPEKMNRGTIQVWFNGDATTAKKYHLDWAMAEWEKYLNPPEP